jgi:uncharacterized protein
MTKLPAIRLSKDVELLPDAVTQTFAVLGKRGSGKTNTASVLAEQLIARGLPVVYVDPVGVVWGMRYSRDGKKPGLPVTILGGEHADVPLEETSGVVVADFLIEHRGPYVLDLGLFSKGAQRRFMVDFAERLYLKNRTAMHVMLDECDTFIPQRIDRGGERLVGAINDLVRKGRARGIGVTLISQRPALINKDVLTQVETLVAHRMTGPQDRDAIERWIEHNADEQEFTGDAVLATLQTLEDGEAWVWSPSWLKILVRRRINLRETFDSSATPKAGENLTPPGRAAEVDLAALRDKLATTIEKAKADDPRELKKRIAELEKRAPKAAEPLLTEEQTKLLAELRDEVLGMTRGGLPNANAEIARCVQLFERFVSGVGEQAARVERLVNKLDKIRQPNGSLAAPYPTVHEAIASMPGRKSADPIYVESDTNDNLPKGERAVLTAIAQNPDGATRDQVSALTGFKKQTRDAYVGRLVRRGFVHDPVRGGPLQATPEGIAALGASFKPLPTGDALVAYWKAKLPQGECAIFSTLVEAWPGGLTREVISDQTGFVKQTRDAYIGRLVRRKIVEKPTRGGDVYASKALMKSAEEKLG